tara:strand:- start:24395 stop:25009 length:615 start_codon:yes stop_codon:yes gene_type:complete
MNVEFNFYNNIYQQLTKRSCDSRTCELLNAVSEIFIEFYNQKEPPSSCVIALAANSGASFSASAASALNCITDQHLLLDEIACFIEDNYMNSASSVLSKYPRVPGFGHPSIKNKDPRVEFLLTEFIDLHGPRTSFCLYLDQSLPVELNIGCAIACLLLDSGIPKDSILYFPLVGRLFGWLKIFKETNQNFKKVVPSNKLLLHDK